jgi:hypothetical protein
MAVVPVGGGIFPSVPAMVAWGDAARDKPSSYRNDGTYARATIMRTDPRVIAIEHARG